MCYRKNKTIALTCSQIPNVFLMTEVILIFYKFPETGIPLFYFRNLFLLISGTRSSSHKILGK